ncbi:MAG: hypothetical protein ACR2QR_10665 [Woeseiaceae bacterium]
MSGGKVISVILLTAVLVGALFEFDIAPSTMTDIVDPAVEANFAACYREKDDEIHTTAFGTIDNPDVQKEFITANRARAAAECRAQHPESLISIEEPGRFNVTLRRW